MIIATCHCGREFRVPDHFAGKIGKCRACGSRLTIPLDASSSDHNAHTHKHDQFPSPLDQSLITAKTGLSPAEIAGEPRHSTNNDPAKEASTSFSSSRPNAFKLNLKFALGLPVIVCVAILLSRCSFFRPNYYSLAPEALKANDPDLAEKYYRLGLEQAIEEDAHFFIAVTHLGLGRVENHRKNWARAEEEIGLAIDEFLCPKNDHKDTNDYNLKECFEELGLSQVCQRKYEKGVQSMEEADTISARLNRGFNEPGSSLGMSSMYRAVASASGNSVYYQRALARITAAEDGLLYSKFGSLRDTLAHVNVLREKAKVAREGGFVQLNPDSMELEANRMEEAFNAREAADKARHQLPSK